jgi:CubicO group peptidase (beta-lactamase class C family)
MVEKLGKLPLVYEPGTRWEYGRSTDVLGRLIEVVSGMPLDRLLEEGIFEPLGMVDSGFWVGAEKKNRVAQPGHVEQLQFDPTVKPRLLWGGHGAVSTASDYARFMQMLLDGGELDGTRLLSPKTVEYMTSDHLGPVPGIPEFWDGYTGYGFGLGFAVRLENGRSPIPGTKGAFRWGGWAGTVFWVDPTEGLIAVGMIQKHSKERYFQKLVRNLVYQSIID